MEVDGKTEENPVKVFKTSAPTSHTPKAVTKWIESLKLNKEAKKKLEKDCEKLAKVSVEDLQSKLLGMGLPMKIVSALKRTELGQMVAAGFALSAPKA